MCKVLRRLSCLSQCIYFFLANTAIAKLKCCHNLGDIVMVIMICGFYTLLEARESFRLRSKES